MNEKKVYCCAIRGRETDEGVSQILEISSETTAVNAITTVQKDCMILEVYRDE